MAPDGLKQLLVQRGVVFTDEALLLQAVTHESVPHTQGGDYRDSYFPFEWRGDAILAFALRDWLLAHHSDSKSRMHAMYGYFASNYFLATDIAGPLGLLNYIRITDSQRPQRSQQYKFEADLFESLVGAIYMDHGFDLAARFALGLILDPMERTIKTGLYEPDKLLKMKAGVKPRYTTVDQHGKLVNGFQFVSTVELDDERNATGLGPRPRIAAMNAAREALAKYFDIQLKDDPEEP